MDLVNEIRDAFATENRIYFTNKTNEGAKTTSTGFFVSNGGDLVGKVKDSISSLLLTVSDTFVVVHSLSVEAECDGLLLVVIRFSFHDPMEERSFL